jgi:hypothetical protein
MTYMKMGKMVAVVLACLVLNLTGVKEPNPCFT